MLNRILEPEPPLRCSWGDSGDSSSDSSSGGDQGGFDSMGDNAGGGAGFFDSTDTTGGPQGGFDSLGDQSGGGAAFFNSTDTTGGQQGGFDTTGDNPAGGAGFFSSVDTTGGPQGGFDNTGDNPAGGGGFFDSTSTTGPDGISGMDFAADNGGPFGPLAGPGGPADPGGLTDFTFSADPISSPMLSGLNYQGGPFSQPGELNQNLLDPVSPISLPMVPVSPAPSLLAQNFQTMLDPSLQTHLQAPVSLPTVEVDSRTAQQQQQYNQQQPVDVQNVTVPPGLPAINQQQQPSQQQPSQQTTPTTVTDPTTSPTSPTSSPTSPTSPTSPASAPADAGGFRGEPSTPSAPGGGPSAPGAPGEPSASPNPSVSSDQPSLWEAAAPLFQKEGERSAPATTSGTGIFASPTGAGTVGGAAAPQGIPSTNTSPQQAPAPSLMSMLSGYAQQAKDAVSAALSQLNPISEAEARGGRGRARGGPQGRGTTSSGRLSSGPEANQSRGFMEAPDPRLDISNPGRDNPRNPSYQDRGLIWQQGQPGRDWQTARQAGITPKFETSIHNWQDLNANLVAALNKAYDRMPESARSSFQLNSGYRAGTRAEARSLGMSEYTSQESVWARAGGPAQLFPAARPGSSNHGHGRAVDIAPGPARDYIRSHLSELGLTTAKPGNLSYDKPHVQLSGQSQFASRGSRAAAGDLSRQQAQQSPEQQYNAAQNLALGRSQMLDDIRADPELRDLTSQVLQGEVGGKSAQTQMMALEMLLNRADANARAQGREATGRDLMEWLSSREEFRDTLNKIEQGKITSGPLTDQMLDQAGRGSNLSNFATTNASKGSFKGGPFGGGPNTSTSGREGFGIQPSTMAWAQSRGYGGSTTGPTGRAFAAGRDNVPSGPYAAGLPQDQTTQTAQAPAAPAPDELDEPAPGAPTAVAPSPQPAPNLPALIDLLTTPAPTAVPAPSPPGLQGTQAGAPAFGPGGPTAAGKGVAPMAPAAPVTPSPAPTGKFLAPPSALQSLLHGLTAPFSLAPPSAPQDIARSDRGFVQGAATAAPGRSTTGALPSLMDLLHGLPSLSRPAEPQAPVGWEGQAASGKGANVGLNYSGLAPASGKGVAPIAVPDEPAPGAPTAITQEAPAPALTTPSPTAMPGPAPAGSPGTQMGGPVYGQPGGAPAFGRDGPAEMTFDQMQQALQQGGGRADMLEANPVTGVISSPLAEMPGVQAPYGPISAPGPTYTTTPIAPLSLPAPQEVQQDPNTAPTVVESRDAPTLQETRGQIETQGVGPLQAQEQADQVGKNLQETRETQTAEPAPAPQETPQAPITPQTLTQQTPQEVAPAPQAPQVLPQETPSPQEVPQVTPSPQAVPQAPPAPTPTPSSPQQQVADAHQAAQQSPQTAAAVAAAHPAEVAAIEQALGVDAGTAAMILLRLAIEQQGLLGLARNAPTPTAGNGLLTLQ